LTFLLNMEDIQLEEEVIHLRELDKSKDEMLASITHDLRSPLASMLKCIEFARESNDLVENHQNLELATSSGMMLMSLISDILDYSLMKKRKFKLNFSYFQLEKLIYETISMMKVQANLKNITLLTNNNCLNYPIFFSDFLRIKQVLVNLIGNSLKFTKCGGQIILEISHSSDPNLIVFSVIDNGVGIKPEIIPKLCKPFHSYDYEGCYNKQGIGLGLHICTNIISQLGPEKQLKIESTYEKGSKFSFILFMNCGFQSEILIDKTLKPRLLSIDTCPFLKEAISEQISNKNIPYINRNNSDNIEKNFPINSPLSPLKQNSNEETEENLISKCQRGLVRVRSDSWKIYDINLENPHSVNTNPCTLYILLADDDVFTIMLMKKMIMKYPQEYSFISIDIEVAYNGEEALNLFEKRNNPGNSKPAFDVVLTDCFMPIKDGFIAAQEMKMLMNEKKYKKCAIYGCSALEEWNKTGEKEVMDGFLRKPVEIGKIFEVLKQVYKKKSHES